MNYAVEMGLCALIYVQSLIEICLAIQKLIVVYTHSDTHTHTQTAR
jgi:hypothetical protein